MCYDNNTPKVIYFLEKKLDKQQKRIIITLYLIIYVQMEENFVRSLINDLRS